MDLLAAGALGRAFRRGPPRLVGEPAAHSDRTRWDARNVRRHGSGGKRFHHPVVGDLTLACQNREMTAESGPSTSPPRQMWSIGGD
jgi:hypothetical protein